MRLALIAVVVCNAACAIAPASGVLRGPPIHAVVFEDDQTKIDPSVKTVEVCLFHDDVLHCVLWETFETLVKRNAVQVPSKTVPAL